MYLDDTGCYDGHLRDMFVNDIRTYFRLVITSCMLGVAIHFQSATKTDVYKNQQICQGIHVRCSIISILETSENGAGEESKFICIRNIAMNEDRSGKPSAIATDQQV